MAPKMYEKAVLEAARAASLAAHSAAGIAAGAEQRAAARMLRSAEALCRAAAAALATVLPSSSSPAVAAGDEGSKEIVKKKKPRKRKKKPKQAEEDQLGTTTVDALAGTVVGDLTELGVTSCIMVVDSAPDAADQIGSVPTLALQHTSSSQDALPSTLPAAEASIQHSSVGAGMVQASLVENLFQAAELKLQTLRNALHVSTGREKQKLKGEVTVLEGQIASARAAAAAAAAR